MATLLGTRYTYYLRSGTNTPDSDFDCRLYIKTYLSSQSTANNTSYIYDQVYVQDYRPDYVGFDYYYTDAGASFNGGTYSSDTYLIENSTLSPTTSSSLEGTYYHTVYHNSSGEGSFTSQGRLKFHFVTDGWYDKFSGYDYTGSKTYSLPTIPRYSAITSFTATVLNPDQISVGWAVDKTVDDVDYSTDGGSTWHDPGGSGTSGSFTISGLDPSTNYSVKIRVKNTASQLTTTSSALSRTTDKLSTLSSSASFNIGSSIPVTISRQTSSYLHKIYVQARKSTSDGWTTIHTTGATIGYSTTITLTTTEKNTLYALIPNNNTAYTRIIVSTYLSGTFYGDTYGYGTATVVSSNPIFTTFTTEDIGAGSILMTGDNQKYIEGYNVLYGLITTTNKAVAQNGATMSSYKMQCGTKSTTTSYSSSATVTLSLGYITDSHVSIIATDSRGNSTTVNKTISIVSYDKPIITSSSIVRADNIGEETTLTFAGTYTNWSGLSTTNSIKTAQYKYKVSGGTYSSYIPITLTTNTSGGFTFTDTINGDLGSTGFSTDDSFEITVYIKDSIYDDVEIIDLSSAQPIIWKYKTTGKSIVGIGKKPDTTLDHGSLDVAGQLIVNDDIRFGDIEGKNLFAKYRDAISNSAVTNTIVSDEIRITTTTIGSYIFSVMYLGGDELLGKTLTMKADWTTSSTNIGRILLYYINSSGGIVSSVGLTCNTSGESETATIPTSFPSTAVGIAVLLYGNAGGTGAIGNYVTFSNIQVEYGENATDYYDHKEVDCIVDQDIDDYSYMKYSNGIMMCWGNTTVSSAGETITLPASYLTSSFNVNITSYYSNYSHVELTFSRTGTNTFRIFPFYKDSAITLNQTMSWMTIGRWK